MANKLESFLSSKKIDQRRLVAVSKRLERLQPEDRAIRLKQRQARKSEDGKKPEGLAKPRSGRPITPMSLQRAFSDERVSGPAKNRILRAVNHILETRKESVVALDALFDTPAPAAKAEAASE